MKTIRLQIMINIKTTNNQFNVFVNGSHSMEKNRFMSIVEFTVNKKENKH